jgi:hypothetical protein
MNEVRSEILEGYRVEQNKIDQYERLLKEGKRRTSSKREASLHEYLNALSLYVMRQSDFYYYSV